MTTMFKNHIVSTMLLAAACGIALAVIAPKTNLARAAVQSEGDRDHREEIRIHAE